MVKPNMSQLRLLMIGMVIIFFAICLFTAGRNQELVYEWSDIVEGLIETGEYKYMGNYSAFMPPLYPAYLAVIYHICSPFTSGMTWLVVANFMQAVLFVCAVYFAFRTFFYGQLSMRLLLFFGAIIFFPPILLAVTKVSSFALALSITLFFLSFAYRVVVLRQRSMLLWFMAAVGLGMYIRYEFGLYFIALSCFLPFFSAKRYRNILAAFGLFVLVYTPWVIRNQVKLNMFTYSTSFRYNFSKGNNITYNIFSSYNMPYDEQKKLRLEDEVFKGVYQSEKEKENYLKKVNQYYLDNHFVHFITNSFKKVGINFLQYFPDNSLFAKPVFAVLYSLFFVMLFLTVILLSIRHIFFSREQQQFLSVFTLVSLVFMLFFYSVSPLPRYALFFYPLFVIYILYWSGRRAIKPAANNSRL